MSAFCAVSKFVIANKMLEEVREAFRNRMHLVDGAPGFLRMDVISPLNRPEEIWLLTFWSDRDAFITLRTHNIGDRVQIEISDTGIGIEPEVMPRIFNLFEQGEQSRIRRFGGLGLGLHIAQAVVELHEGRLSAFSEGKNKGTTFTVELAAAASQEKAPVPPAPSVEPQERSLRILLVEDHLDTLQCLVKILKKWGHTVATAENVRTAIEMTDGEQFDLLVSDLGLPDGTGLDVMRHVKERSGIPGIALSGFGTEEDIRQSKAAGFEDHLVKPVNVVALRAAIREFAPTKL